MAPPTLLQQLTSGAATPRAILFTRRSAMRQGEILAMILELLKSAFEMAPERNLCTIATPGIGSVRIWPRISPDVARGHAMTDAARPRRCDG